MKPAMLLNDKRLARFGERKASNMLWPQRRPLANEFALISGLSSRCRGCRLRLDLDGHPPWLVRRDQDARPACPNEQPTSAVEALPSCGRQNSGLARRG